MQGPSSAVAAAPHTKHRFVSLPLYLLHTQPKIRDGNHEAPAVTEARVRKATQSCPRFPLLCQKEPELRFRVIQSYSSTYQNRPTCTSDTPTHLLTRQRMLWWCLRGVLAHTSSFACSITEPEFHTNQACILHCQCNNIYDTLQSL